MQAPATVILSGASGFIGTYVKRRLMEQSIGVELMTLNIRELTVPTAPIMCTGIGNGTQYDLSTLRDCTLVHLAWCPPVRDRYGPHAEQVRLLAELLDSHAVSIGRIIAFGSAEEYGPSSGHLQEQDAIDQNLSAYGWGKRAAQIMVESWCNSQGKPGLWLRPFLVYGEGQQGGMALPYAVRQALRREVAEFSAGTQERDFIHVDDVARAVVLAVNQTWSGFNVANLGTGVSTKLRDVLEQVAEQFGATDLFKYGVRPMRLGEPEFQVAATERAAKILGFTARINLDEGIRRMKPPLRSPHDNV